MLAQLQGRKSLAISPADQFVLAHLVTGRSFPPKAVPSFVGKTIGWLKSSG